MPILHPDEPFHTATVAADFALLTPAPSPPPSPLPHTHKHSLSHSLSVCLTRCRVDAMRPSIEAKVDELINDMMKQGAPVDLAEHFSLPIAFKVIYELLGIPFEVGGTAATLTAEV